MPGAAYTGDDIEVHEITCSLILVLSEIQDSHRGSTTPKAHGVPWRCSAGGDHERPGGILDDAC